MRALVTAFSIAVLAGCFGDDGPSVRDYVAEVATVDGTAHATFVSGSPPHGAGPTVEAVTNASVIPGGTAPVTLTATQPFTTAIIAVDGLGGYFKIDLPSAAASAQLLVTLSQDLAATSFVWVYGAGSGGGFGYTMTPVTVVPVGTGDVQVSLSWSTLADVDLHVIDPANEEIFWANRASASGGTLDLDSNAACGSDGPRNENITWPAHGAPSGTYRVLVDYWSNCTAGATPFTVTVNVHGHDPETFSGTLTGPGDSGGPGAGMPITTFTSGAAARSLGGHRLVGTFDVEPGTLTYAK